MDDVLPDWPWRGCVVGNVDGIEDANVEEFAGIELAVVPDVDDTSCTIVDADGDMPAIGMRVFDTSWGGRTPNDDASSRRTTTPSLKLAEGIAGSCA